MSKNKSQSNLPNFIIAGATASGTSFLTHLLMQHCDVYLPKELDLEPHFFSITKRYEKGFESYLETWFSDCNNQKAIGERSSSYFHFPEAAGRLKQHLPKAKFIFVLRDPSDRAFAHYRYMVLRGIEELEFEEALTEESNRFDPEKRHLEYQGRSFYGRQLENFLKSYPLNQLLFISSQKLRHETAIQLKRVTDFLSIDPLNNYTISSEFPSPSVKSRPIQAEGLKHFGKNFKVLIEAIRYNKTNLNNYLTTDEDRHYLLKIMQNLSEVKEVLKEETKRKLDAYFKDDQKKFFNLAKSVIDFKDWN